MEMGGTKKRRGNKNGTDSMSLWDEEWTRVESNGKGWRKILSAQPEWVDLHSVTQGQVRVAVRPVNSNRYLPRKDDTWDDGRI